MAINPVVCVTRDILLTSNVGGGGNSKQPVMFVGDGMLLKNLMPLVPADKLLKITGTAGNRFATFITGLTALPTQNLSNFSSALRRFQVDRAALGAEGIEISAMGKANVKARVRVTVTVTRLKLNDPPGTALPAPAPPHTYDLGVRHAFSCFTNHVASADVILNLPAAKRTNVGLEYYFAINPDIAGSLTIKCKDRDSIQIRESQTFDPVPPTVIATTKAVDASQIKGTNATAAKDKTMVLSCKAPRLWVAENVTAKDDNTVPLAPDWTITKIN